MKYKEVEYIEHFGCLNDDVVSVLASGKFPTDDADAWKKYLESTYRGDRVLAVIEFPYIDIELEAYTGDGNEPSEAADDDNGIVLGYVVCIKGLYCGEEVWQTDDFAGECTVDFSSENWEELLEKEMVERLAEYVEKRGYSFTEPNFDDE